nr:hypothetical protein [Xenococcaceae cyanobacterium MO_234.B1]
GVLAAKVYRDSNHSLRVLDGFAGCGVRSLRYWLESKADFLWVNEGNPDLSSVLEANLQSVIPEASYRVTYLDANRVFFDCYNRRDYYDLLTYSHRALRGILTPHDASFLLRSPPTRAS